MTDTAIARIEAIALHENQPLIQERGFVVELQPNNPVDNSEYDCDYVPLTLRQPCQHYQQMHYYY
jgi:hypothetical protein